jgi:hypothetical protein
VLLGIERSVGSAALAAADKRQAAPNREQRSTVLQKWRFISRFSIQELWPKSVSHQR